GRLHGRVSGGRSRAEDGLDRAVRAPWGRLPQRRLYPIEGAFALCPGRCRGRRDGDARNLVWATQGRPRRAPRLEGVGRREADRGARAACWPAPGRGEPWGCPFQRSVGERG